MSRLEENQEAICRAYCSLYDAHEHIEDVLKFSTDASDTFIDKDELCEILDELEGYRQVIHTIRERLFLKTE